MKVWGLSRLTVRGDEMLNRCCFIVGPSSSTLAQHSSNICLSCGPLGAAWPCRRGCHHYAASSVTPRWRGRDNHSGHHGDRWLIAAPSVVRYCGLWCAPWRRDKVAWKVVKTREKRDKPAPHRKVMVIVCSAMQWQKAVTAYLKSKQLLPFGVCTA